MTNGAVDDFIFQMARRRRCVVDGPLAFSANGEFTLVHYDVDPTSDGEINPETVLDFETAP